MFILPITRPNNAPNHTMALSSLSITWNMSFSVSFTSISFMRSLTILQMSMESRILGRCSVMTLRYMDSIVSTALASCASCPSSYLQTGLLKKLLTSPSTIFDTISLPLLRSIVLMLLARKCVHK